jgi:cytosine deaminase
MSHREMRDPFKQAAIDEAKGGLAEGGIPIGSVLVVGNQIIGRGHDRRVQRGNAIPHAEMDAIGDAGRLTASDDRSRPWANCSAWGSNGF